MKESLLTPCPFCGEDSPSWLTLFTNQLNDTRQIYCDRCGARGPVRRGAVLAGIAWNERVAKVTKKRSRKK